MDRSNHASRGSAGRAFGALAALLMMGALSGCAAVAPYERGKLAHPTMTAGDLTGFAEGHVRAVTEGAVGGNGGTGSGCGCN